VLDLALCMPPGIPSRPLTLGRTGLQLKVSVESHGGEEGSPDLGVYFVGLLACEAGEVERVVEFWYESLCDCLECFTFG